MKMIKLILTLLLLTLMIAPSANAAGPTITDATLAGTTTNSGTITGGAINLGNNVAYTSPDGTVYYGLVVNQQENSQAFFTGSITGSMLTVSGWSGGHIVVGDFVEGAGVANGTRITFFQSGTPGENGTYIINPAQYVAAEPMTTPSGGKPANANDNFTYLGPGGNVLSMYSEDNNTMSLAWSAEHFPYDGSANTVPDIGAWFADNNCAFVAQSNTNNVTLGNWVLYGNAKGNCNATGGGYFALVPLLTEDNFTAVPTLTQSGNFVAEGTIALSGTLSSSKPCHTGFNRRTPNYCVRGNNSTAVEEVWINATGCTARATGQAFVPDDGVRAVDLAIHWQALANNATGPRMNEVYFFGTNTCPPTKFNSRSLFNVYEQTATSVGTILGEYIDHVRVQINTDSFNTMQTNIGGNGNASIVGFTVEGYYD